MSIRKMTEVWDHGPDDRSELLVLLALADWSSEDGYCWPSMQSLAEKARTTQRGAQKIVARLVENGWLEIKTGGGRGGTNVYRILPAKKPSDTPETPNGVHPEHGSPPEHENTKPRTRVHKTPNGGSPEPSGTIKNPPRDAGARTRGTPPEGFDAFWEAHPRPKNREGSLAAFAEAVRQGIDPERIVAGAERYRAEKGHEAKRWLSPTDDWLKARRWEDHEGKAPEPDGDGASAMAQFWASKVRAGAYIPSSAISAATAQEMLDASLVSVDELRRVGVSP